MGVIQKQSLQKTVLNFVGVFIGMISILFVYSLDNDIYGYAQFLLGASSLLVPVASIGLIPTVIKFFPKYSEKEDRIGALFSLVLVLAVLGVSIFLFFTWLFRDPFIAFLESLQMDGELVRSNLWIILVLTIALVIIDLATAHASNYHKVVVPSFIKEFAYKLYLPVLVLVYVFRGLDNLAFANGILAFYILAAGAMIFYLYRLRAIRISRPSFLNSNTRKSMFSYMGFGSLNSIGNSLASRIDSIMITIMLSTASAGLYFKVLFIANVIGIPSRALSSIASPIVSETWEKNNLEEINKLYQRSSLNLFLVGCFLFVFIYYALDGLVSISADPSSFENAKSIFVFLASAKLIEMISSISAGVLSYSAKYRYNLLFVLLLGIANVIFNYYFIGEFNVVGAAMATALSITLFHLFRMGFIYFEYKMHPLSTGLFKSFVIASVGFLIAYGIPELSNPFFNSVLKCSVASVVMAGLFYYLKVSMDVNSLIKSSISKLYPYE